LSIASVCLQTAFIQKNKRIISEKLLEDDEPFSQWRVEIPGNEGIPTAIFEEHKDAKAFLAAGSIGLQRY